MGIFGVDAWNSLGKHLLYLDVGHSIHHRYAT
jgi:hypothetical protein